MLIAQTFRNPKPELLALLQDSGSADANGVRGKDSSKKKARRDKAVDMEKLADGLQKLSEDDLLHVVTMVHDNKTSETYTKNDVESESSGRSPFELIDANGPIRRRVPRRPLHPARLARQDAVGLHSQQDRDIGTRPCKYGEANRTCSLWQRGLNAPGEQPPLPNPHTPHVESSNGLRNKSAPRSRRIGRAVIPKFHVFLLQRV